MRIEYDENGNPIVIRSEHTDTVDETKRILINFMIYHI